jgi:hypothetical protein
MAQQAKAAGVLTRAASSDERSRDPIAFLPSGA